MTEQDNSCGCSGEGHGHGHGHGHHKGHGKPHFYGTATVGEKGQIVIPAEARKANDIKTGDKIVVAGGNGKHPLMLIKAEVLTDKIEHLSNKIEFLKSIQETEEDSDSA